MNSESRARLERLGPIQAITHDRSFSDEHEAVLLRRDPVPFVTAIPAARRLFASGMPMRAAHAAINDLAAQGWTMVDIPVDGGIDDLARDLPALGVHLHRPRHVAEPAAFIADVRARHKLSQREFASALGLDVRTLQNWEQGRNRPDCAVLSLIRLFDGNPDLVRDAVFEPVA
jgi:DNA-binding XRE family transcriptional regulator